MKRLWNNNKQNLGVGLKILIGILAISMLAHILKADTIVGSLAASCGLIFTVPSASSSRFSNILVAHLIAATIGLVIFCFLGNNVIAISIAGALTVLAMEWSKKIHPPACATAVVAVISQAKFIFAVDIALGAILLICITIFLNSFAKIKRV